MNDLLQSLRTEFQDEDYRYAYAESFLNTKLATQIKTLREQRGMTQVEIAAKMGIKQPGYRRFEDVNHSVWKTDSLWDIARANGVRLNISFETFGTLIEDKKRFTREALQRPDFEHDSVFKQPNEGSEKAVATMSATEKNLRELMGRELTADELDLVRQHNEGRASAGSQSYALPIKRGGWNTLQQIATTVPMTGLLDSSPEWFAKARETGQLELRAYIKAKGFTGGNLKTLAGSLSTKGLAIVPPKAKTVKAENPKKPEAA